MYVCVCVCMYIYIYIYINSVQSLSCVQLFATPWTAAHQASLSITKSLLKFMSIELVMPSNHLILCCPLLLPSIFPSIRVFSSDQFFASGDQSIGALASASILPTNTQDWFPLGLTSLISLQSKGLSRVFSSTAVWKHQFFGTQTLWSNSHIQTWLSTRDLGWFDPWVRKIPCRREWQPTPVFLPENSMGRGGWQATPHGVSKS